MSRLPNRGTGRMAHHRAQLPEIHGPVPRGRTLFEPRRVATDDESPLRRPPHEAKVMGRGARRIGGMRGIRLYGQLRR